MNSDEKLFHNIAIAEGELLKIERSGLANSQLTKYLFFTNLELVRISKSIYLTYHSHLNANLFSVDLIEMGLRKSIEIAIFCNWIVDENDSKIINRILAHQSKAFESSWEIPDPEKFTSPEDLKGLPKFKNMSETTIKGAWLAYKRLSWLHHASTMQLYALLESEREKDGLSPKELFIKRSSDSLKSQAESLEHTMGYLGCELVKLHPDKIELTPSVFK